MGKTRNSCVCSHHVSLNHKLITSKFKFILEIIAVLFSEIHYHSLSPASPLTISLFWLWYWWSQTCVRFCVCVVAENKADFYNILLYYPCLTSLVYRLLWNTLCVEGAKQHQFNSLCCLHKSSVPFGTSGKVSVNVIFNKHLAGSLLNLPMNFILYKMLKIFRIHQHVLILVLG